MLHLVPRQREGGALVRLPPLSGPASSATPSCLKGPGQGEGGWGGEVCGRGPAPTYALSLRASFAAISWEAGASSSAGEVGSWVSRTSAASWRWWEKERAARRAFRNSA